MDFACNSDMQVAAANKILVYALDIPRAFMALLGVGLTRLWGPKILRKFGFINERYWFQSVFMVCKVVCQLISYHSVRG